MAPAEADVAAVVSNPVDVDSWRVGYRKQDYVLFMARMVEEKGPHRAIRVAQAASWWEPFGLVMVEALAAGTPVLAFWHARPTVAVPARQPHE
jgi:glycosyltransferase involved in cell wall biosynthesis